MWKLAVAYWLVNNEHMQCSLLTNHFVILLLNNCSDISPIAQDSLGITGCKEDIVDIIVKSYLLHMYLSSIYFVKQITYSWWLYHWFPNYPLIEVSELKLICATHSHFSFTCLSLNFEGYFVNHLLQVLSFQARVASVFLSMYIVLVHYSALHTKWYACVDVHCTCTL